MFSLSILEDFCFSTKQEVESYTYEEKLDSPSIPGYQWTQPCFKIAVFADTGGTAYWLAKNVTECEKKVEAGIFPVCEFDEIAYARINSLPNVVCLNANDEQGCIRLLSQTDSVVLICSNTTMRSWFERIDKNRKLRHGLLIVFDPSRDLEGLNGSYYMNSSIWVSN